MYSSSCTVFTLPIQCLHKRWRWQSMNIYWIGVCECWLIVATATISFRCRGFILAIDSFPANSSLLQHNVFKTGLFLVGTKCKPAKEDIWSRAILSYNKVCRKLWILEMSRFGGTWQCRSVSCYLWKFYHYYASSLAPLGWEILCKICAKMFHISEQYHS